jgi:4,5-DOPA dioxygenase extradiol
MTREQMTTNDAKLMTTNDQRMPVLFIGHGNPMNAIERNEFSDSWQALGETLSKPKAILCISAHWETFGTAVTAMEHPKTIHDFSGFPQELFNVQYPSPGDPALADELINTITKFQVKPDNSWGLDHGCWSILCRMYPLADIPVAQLSLDRNQPTSRHYELGRELYFLREKGVLIIGSGNMVHNLRRIEWENENGADWAEIANHKLKELIKINDHEALMNYKTLGNEVQHAIPTPEHFLPLLYILALKQNEEKISFFNDQIVMGSLAMTSLRIG